MLELCGRIELNLAYFANGTLCAVTNEGSQTEDVSDHSLVLRGSEHKGNKLADCCEHHHYMVGGLSLILSIARIFTGQSLGDELSDVVLVGDP